MESYYAMQNRSIIQKRPLIAMSHRSHALNSRSAYPSIRGIGHIGQKTIGS